MQTVPHLGRDRIHWFRRANASGSLNGLTSKSIAMLLRSAALQHPWLRDGILRVKHLRSNSKCTLHASLSNSLGATCTPFALLHNEN